MRHKRLKLFALFLLGLGLTGLQAQESTLTSGGNASGSGGSASYSVGQVVYKTYNGNNGSMVNGSQQPYEISVVTGFEDTPGINLSASIYPNPTSDFLVLNVENYDYSTLTIHLYNSGGKVLSKRNPESRQTNLDLSNLAPAVYFITITQNNKEIKTFKIIKK